MRRRKEPKLWFDGQQNHAAAIRLFCIPYAGGGARAFFDWQREMPTQIEVCAIRLPGREQRFAEVPYRRMPDLVDALADAVETRLDRPFALFGHSMGALVAFELARLLRRRHRVLPEWLFVSSHRAPHIPVTDTRIHQLSDSRFVERVKAYYGLPPAVLQNRELLNLMMPVLRADVELCSTYLYADQEPLACPVGAFGGLYDRGVKREVLEAWRRHTRGEFRLALFPGDHFYQRQNQTRLLKEISNLLRLKVPEAFSGEQ